MVFSGKPVGNGLWVLTCNGVTISRPVSYERAYTAIWKLAKAVK